jgi:hypothetical protein
LAALITDVYTIGFTNLDRVETWRLSADCVHSGRCDFDVFAIPNEPAKQSFGNGTSADIAGANKEDAFHGRIALAMQSERKFEQGRGQSGGRVARLELDRFTAS